MRDHRTSQSLAEFQKYYSKYIIYAKFIVLELNLSVMAYCAKRSRIEDYESENSDSPIGMIEEATGG